MESVYIFLIANAEFTLNNSFLDFKIIDIQASEAIWAQCKGNSDKGIFICYPTTDIPQSSFLAKILAAVKLDLVEDALCLEKTNENNFSFSTFNKTNKFQKALFFGVNPQSIGLQINYNKYQPINIGQCQYLFADDLTDIAQNQNLKKLLWKALQEIFN